MTRLACHSHIAAVFARIITLALLGVSLTISTQAQKKKNRKSADDPQLVIAEAKQSRYRIIVPAAATPDEQRAAQVLQEHILQISGAALPVIKASQSRSPYEIVLGQNERLDDLRLGINFNVLKEDGFVIRTDSARLIIAGGSEKGTLYGVYTFLEEYLGCRMYTPAVKVVPQHDRIALAPISANTQVPVIGFRDTHYRVTWDAAYTEWHKLDHDAGGGRPDWGMWVHTFNTLVPPEVYYNQHPEYFAEVKGKRIPTQLCLTNPEVAEITIQSLRRMIAANPAAKYWSVSQNDNRDFCTCDKCKHIDDREGSPTPFPTR
jgi:hypothetical protein